MHNIKSEILAEMLRKQQFLLENQLFDPYEYFGITRLSQKTKKIIMKTPLLKVRKNCESMLSASFNKEEKLLNRSLSLQRDLSLKKKTIKTKPFHLKIDLNESREKKNFEIGSSRSASKLTIKPYLKTPQNSQTSSGKKSFLTNKKTMKNGMNEKRECYFTENKIREKKGETREKERGKEGKKRILMENAEIMNTMKGLDAKYQNIYLNFVKANKKKN